MFNPYATTPFIVNMKTQQKYDKPSTLYKQRVEVPVGYVEDVKIGGGRTRMLTREVTVLGTVEVMHYGTKRVEYGKCVINSHVVAVVQNGNSWKVVERKPINGCVA